MLQYIELLLDSWDEGTFLNFLEHAKDDKEADFFQKLSDQKEEHEINAILNLSRSKETGDSGTGVKNEKIVSILKKIDAFDMQSFAKKRSVNLSTLYPFTAEEE